MKINRLPLLALFLTGALACLAGAAPVWAQEEEDSAGEDDGRAVTLLVEIEAWSSQPAGLDFNPATQVDPNNPYQATLHTFDYESDPAARYRAGILLKENLGAVILTWYGQSQEMDLVASSPGNFQFGEIASHPLYAGFANNGLADAYSASATAVLRDFRIDYYRTAFKSSKITGKWFVGWRRVQHKRDMTVEYPALAAPLPPLIPPFVPSPRDDLQPGSDLATISSHWEGRGVNAGMDFVMPLWQNKISLVGGFALAMLRGKTDASYSSTNYIYTRLGEVLQPPYDELNDPDLVGEVRQETNVVSLQANSRSTASGVFEGYVGARWDATRWLGVQLGFRSTYYDNVGVELRPKVVAIDDGIMNLQDVTETDYSVTYEGFFLGVDFRF